MLELLPTLKSLGPRHLSSVRGIVFSNEARELVRTPDRARLPDLDAAAQPGSRSDRPPIPGRLADASRREQST